MNIQSHCGVSSMYFVVGPFCFCVYYSAIVDNFNPDQICFTLLVYTHICTYVNGNPKYI